MKNWMKRALRTFLQTAIGYAAVNIAAVDLSGSGSALKTALIGLAVSSVSAGAAAAMNLKEN